MELASLILSIIALLGSLVTYIVHDRKIKKQEAKINEYQLAKIKEEEEDSKKAQVCGNIIKYDKGKRVLKVYNKGKAPAKNIRIEGIDENMYFDGTELLPFGLLNPQEAFELTFNIYNINQHILKITIHWDDLSHNDNTFTQQLSLV